MDTSWWLALAAVVLLALVATLVDGWGRGRRPERRRTRPPGRRAGPQGRAARPHPGDIWWAKVPSADGHDASGHEAAGHEAAGHDDSGPDGRDRPCLVLAVRGNRAT